jgi:hypothetical protein
VRTTERHTPQPSPKFPGSVPCLVKGDGDGLHDQSPRHSHPVRPSPPLLILQCAPAQTCSEHQCSALTPTAQRYGILVIITLPPVGNEAGSYDSIQDPTASAEQEASKVSRLQGSSSHQRPISITGCRVPLILVIVIIIPILLLILCSFVEEIVRFIGLERPLPHGTCTHGGHPT